MTEPQDDVWKNATLVRNFLTGVRGGIPYAQDQIEIMLRVIAARDEPVERCLDLGSGSGTLAAAVLDRYPRATATLVDFSEPMMEAARARFGAAATRHRFVSADFGESDWTIALGADACFDLVASGYAIHHQPDGRKRAVYREVFDLLAPGGLFVNVEHVASATPWLERISDELLVDSLSDYHRREGTGKTREQVARDHVYRPDKAANILTPVEDQCAWLREIGYQDVDCYFKVFELAVFGGRRPS